MEEKTKKPNIHPIKSGFVQIDHFLKETKKKKRAIEEGLICPLCDTPMIIMGDVCKCQNDCFEYSHRVSDMKAMIKLAKKHKKGIFREEKEEEEDGQ
jgi:hypothetical protein